MAKKEYVEDKSYGKVRVVTIQGYKMGVLDMEGNEIVPFGKYDWIDGFERGLARVRTPKVYAKKEGSPKVFGKWGIINEKGEEVLPLEYDSVWNFLGKNYDTIIVEKNGITSKIRFVDLNPNLPFPSSVKRSGSYVSGFEKDDSYYDDNDYAKDTWDAMTDGMYDDDMPEDFGYDVDYESLGF